MGRDLVVIIYFPYGGNCRWGKDHRAAIENSRYALLKNGMIVSHVSRGYTVREMLGRYRPESKTWIKTRHLFYAWIALMDTEEEVLRVAEEMAGRTPSSKKFLIALSLMADKHFRFD